jgi:dolichol kinase
LAETSIIDLTSGLYRLMATAEAALLRKRQLAEDVRLRLLARAQALADQFAAARASASARVAANLGAAAAHLRRLGAALEERTGWHPELRARWHALGRQYEALRIQLQPAAGVTFPSLKPRNLYRNLFHACMGVGSTLLYQLVLSRSTLIVLGAGILGLFILMDVIRRVSPTWNERFVQRIFGAISRPGEAHRVPSATYYVAALTLGAILLPQHGIEVGALILGLGDPAASLVGKRWGRRKLIGEKSLAGSLAFFVVGTIAATTLLVLVRPALGLGAVAIAAAAALAGALVELLPVEDNLTIPLVAGLVAALLL